MKKRGTSWVDPKKIYSRVDDDGFVQHWKPIIEGIATKMIRDYRLPDSNFDDLLSDGLLALCRVPKDARWNSKYVWMAVVNQMRRCLQNSRTRFSRYELWGNVPDTQHSTDGHSDRLELDTLVRELRGEEGLVIKLFIAGKTEREIADYIGGSVKEAKMFLSAAVQSMRRQARINS